MDKEKIETLENWIVALVCTALLGAVLLLVTMLGVADRRNREAELEAQIVVLQGQEVANQANNVILTNPHYQECLNNLQIDMPTEGFTKIIESVCARDYPPAMVSNNDAIQLIFDYLGVHYVPYSYETVTTNTAAHLSK